MSITLQGRGVFGFSGGFGILGCRTLSCPNSQGRVPTTFCLPSSSVANADSPSELLPHFRQGVRSFCFCERLADEGCHRTGILGTRFLQPLFVTPKVTGGWRPVIDLSRLNRFVRLSHFRMETSLSVLHSLRSGDWMISIDLQDAYFQFPVHPESRRYLRFCLGHQTSNFGFVALVFHPLRKCSRVAWP